MHAGQPENCEENPAGASRENEEAEKTEPQGCGFVVSAHEYVVKVVREQGCRQETNGKNGNRDPEPGNSSGIGRSGKRLPRLKYEPVKQKKDGLRAR
jgi:hypothetical protein